MSELGSKLFEIQGKIESMKKELLELGDPDDPLPELITSANLLRTNESLKKINDIQKNLIITYEQYSRELANTVSTALKIQKKLNSQVLLKSKRSSNKSPKKKKTAKRKTKPKRR